MKRAIALVTALLAAGCGGTQQKITAEEARGAVPSADQTNISVGQGSALTAAPAGSEAAYQTADYANLTMTMAAVVNGGVAWTLGSVGLVASLPPTSCDGDTCTWGPWTNAFEVNSWKLTVTKKAAQQFEWALSGQPKTDPSAGFVSFVSGEAFTTGLRYVGHGALVVDFDAAAQLARKTTDPELPVGKITAAYDNTTSPRTVSAQFLNTKDVSNPAHRVNAAYQFTAESTGGDLQVASRNLDTAETLALRSRWTSVGAGRADATYQNGTVTYARSQCWDASSTLFNLVYQVTTPPAIGDTGAVSSCVFPTAAAPDIQAP